MARPGRNDPCPCGSGKKYKRCCLDKEQGAGEAALPTTHALDHRLLSAILDAAAREHGPSLDAAARRLPLAEGDEGENCAGLQATWLGYHALVEGRTPLDWFLAAREATLAPHERGWLHAQRRAAFSMHDVARIDLGAGLLLRDLLAGTEVYVREARATPYLRSRSVICARVVMWNGASVMVGMHPQSLGPLEADTAVRSVRRRLGVAGGPIATESLRDAECLPVLRAWGAAVIAEYEKPPPTLVNTDDEPLLQVTDVFRFAAHDRERVVEKLARLEGAERDVVEPGVKDEVALTRPGNAMHASWTNTIVARIEVGRDQVRVETNSLHRAALARRRLGRAFKGILVHGGRTILDPAKALGERGSGSESAPPRRESGLAPKVEARPVRELKEREYADWPDRPIPLLGGATPREALKRPRLAHRVELLLRDIEATESGEPVDRRFDVAALRAQLGLRA